MNTNHPLDKYNVTLDKYNVTLDNLYKKCNSGFYDTQDSIIFTSDIDKYTMSIIPNIPAAIIGRLYREAWDEGHSYGYGSVLDEYIKYLYLYIDILKIHML